MATTRIWILDGHNMIFAIPRLQRLQISDRREEARRGLVDRLSRFARARGEKVLVVFDGNDLASNPDVIREPFIETVYTRRSDGAADDRIIHEARSRLERGHHVTVVTNDVHTLAHELPAGVHHLGVEAFWRKYIEKPAGKAGKRVEGDFSDVEREMVARAAIAVHEPEAGGLDSAANSALLEEPGKEPVAGSDSSGHARARAEETMRERIRRKREKGRLHQERRLKRRSGPGRRR